MFYPFLKSGGFDPYLTSLFDIEHYLLQFWDIYIIKPKTLVYKKIFFIVLVYINMYVLFSLFISQNNIDDKALNRLPISHRLLTYWCNARITALYVNHVKTPPFYQNTRNINYAMLFEYESILENIWEYFNETKIVFRRKFKTVLNNSR